MKRLTVLLTICLLIATYEESCGQYADSCNFLSGQKIQVSCNKNSKIVHFYRFSMKQAGMDTIEYDSPDTVYLFEPLPKDAEFWIRAKNNMGWSEYSDKAIAIYKVPLITDMPFVATGEDLSTWSMARWGSATKQYRPDYKGEKCLFMISNGGRIDIKKDIIFEDGLHEGIIKFEARDNSRFQIYVGAQLVYEALARTGSIKDFPIQPFTTSGRQTVRLSLGRENSGLQDHVYLALLKFYSTAESVPDKPVIRLKVIDDTILLEPNGTWGNRDNPNKNLEIYGPKYHYENGIAIIDNIHDPYWKNHPEIKTKVMLECWIDTTWGISTRMDVIPQKLIIVDTFYLNYKEYWNDFLSREPNPNCRLK